MSALASNLREIISAAQRYNQALSWKVFVEARDLPIDCQVVSPFETGAITMRLYPANDSLWDLIVAEANCRFEKTKADLTQLGVTPPPDNKNIVI